MQNFNSELFLTTSEVAELFSVHPSTVKRWCTREGLQHETTEGGHRRIYLRNALEFAGEKGVETFLDPFSPFEPHVWLALRDAVELGDFRRVVSLAMGWLVRGYPQRVTSLFLELGRREDLPFARLADRGIRPFMREVGESWREGRLRIAEEHLASQAVMEALMHLLPPRSTNWQEPGLLADGRSMVAVTGAMAGDQHHIGAMCIRVVLERAGWMVHYLGPDTPPEEFAALQRERRAALVCVSFSPPTPQPEMNRCLEVLSRFYQEGAPYTLVFGGEEVALREPPAEGLPFPEFRLFDGAEAFASWLEEEAG